ncbi:hypothetical protein GFM12_06880 [Pseudomonas aeruginosa]|uniref:hypothetical protein n=1 Tax=Pseudomonas aeruginosa TaxID=287 RepID=UPI00190C923B|nr:hypothetical protein [Pseudomonas aeruginosa]MBK3752268.1 hypothetical protein [Pseudomonas aeruginosa]MBK3762506.1 hypothetical protein [Pseudomonas aeruginosa]MBK3769046.1 hypothetical protein [Pseudomonas aeruginosa]MBK3789234.1 hypothetical protein [Pseudomonas aeruginosa]MBK3885280.1 hypothetical protein [Pseudomonas aeruginosa]
MNHFTLSINGQSVRFTLDDFAALEAVMSEAARTPGREAFRDSTSGRISATLEIAASRGRFKSPTPPTGRQYLSQQGQVLTDC